MRITEIRGTHLEMTKTIEQYVENRLTHVAKIVGRFEPSSVKVELERMMPDQNKGKIFRAELNLSLPGSVLRSEASAEDMYAAVDEAVDKMARQARKYKDKHSA